MKRIVLFVLMLALFCSVQAQTLSDSQDDAEKLAGILSDYQTVASSFTQYTADKSGRVLQETQGKLVAKRPGYFYWRVLPPLEQVIVSDGAKVMIYDPDLEQATIQRQSDQLGSTPALLLSGQVDQLKQAYDIVYIKGEQGISTFILRPKGKESLFDTLRLQFKDRDLTEMRLTDALGQKSVLMFTDLVINAEVGEEQFSFSLPEGVDVIEDRLM